MEIEERINDLSFQDMLEKYDCHESGSEWVILDNETIEGDFKIMETAACLNSSIFSSNRIKLEDSLDIEEIVKNQDRDYEDARMFYSIFEESESDEHIGNTTTSSIRRIASTALSMYASLRHTLNVTNHLTSMIHVIQLYLVNLGEQESMLSEETIKSERKRILTHLINSVGADWKLSDLGYSKELRELRDEILFTQTKEEYLALLDSTTELVVPVNWKYEDEYGQQNGNLAEAKISDLIGTLQEVSEKEANQDGKDIQRDRIFINGELLEGIWGYDQIVNSIVQIMKKSISDVRLNSFESGNNAKDLSCSEIGIETDSLFAFAKKVLQIANRTQSGGCSYEVLERLVRQPELAILRPDSHQAEPLAISVDVGPYAYKSSTCVEEEQLDHWSYGLRVKVEALTSYLVVDAINPSVEWGNISAKYLNRLAISLSSSPFTDSGTHRAARLDRGSVLISCRNILCND